MNFFCRCNLHYEKFADGTVKCIEDEIPFEVPEGWEWCRLSEVVELYSGQDLTPNRYNNIKSGIPYITGASNFSNGMIIVNRWTTTPTVLSKAGDLLLVCKGSGVGKMVYSDIEDAHIARQIMALRCKFAINCSYLKTVISAIILDITAQANGIIPGIRRETVLSSIIPLPPINEQVAISDKVNCALNLLNNIESEKTDLQATIQLAKSKILNMAIRGKLVPQDPNDELASVLLEHIQAEKEELIKQVKIKRDKKESVIFKGEDNSYYDDIPNSWTVTTLNDVCWLENGQITESGKQPYLEAKVLRGLILPSFQDTGILVKEKTKLILVDGENSGEVFITPFTGYMGSTFKLLKINREINEDYVLKVIAFYKNLLREKKTGSAIPHLNKTLFKTLLINIPPLAEQKRIVDAIEAYFAALDRISNSLT